MPLRPVTALSRIAQGLLLWTSLQGCALFGGPAGNGERQIERALATGDTARAVKMLGGVIHRSDASPETYVRLGVLLRSSGSITGRARSQAVLERGMQLYPEHAAVVLELAKTYYRQTLYGDAGRLFRRVLEIEPGHCEATFWLARNSYRQWKHVQVYKEYLQTARRLAGQVVACDPDNSEALYMLAFTHYALGDSEKALARTDEYIAKNADDAKGYLLRGVAAFEGLQYEQCADFFARGLALSTPEEAAAIESITLLLDEEEGETYEKGSREQREERQRIFWIARDPDPTTVLNERHLEHIYRMFLADQYFRHDLPALRGWETERGRALVKFGWPEGVSTTLAGDFTSGRMEVWQYANQRNFFTLYFRDEFLNGNYMVPMDYRYSYAAQTLYLEEPTTEYQSPYALIPGVVDLTAFKNPSVGSDVYATIAVDTDSMGAFFTSAAPSRLYTRSAVFDGEWAPLEYGSDTVAVDGLWNAPPGSLEPHQRVRRFEPGFGVRHFALCIEDDLSLTQTILQDETNTIRFLSDSLLVSDVLLHRRRVNVDESGLIRRGGHVLLPNPSHIYPPGEKLKLYFEIYNLRVTRARNRYDVTYSIYDARDDLGRWERFRRGFERMIGVGEAPAPVISQTIERSGSLHNVEEDIAIDIAALRAGPYVIHIAVLDLIGGTKAEAQQAFVKAGRPPAAAR